ncbi:MAG TPA: MFS transporter [Anaerolineaceae bacterium]|nr:MFS transporter [Anaerolineaceae bacterium]
MTASTSSPTSPELQPNQRDLWILRVYYLAWIGGAGFIAPFLNLNFTREGLNGTQIGVLLSIGAVIALISAPLWSQLTERFKRPVSLLQLSMILTGLLTLALGQVHLFQWLVVIYALRVLASAGAGPVSDALTVRIIEKLDVGFGSVRVWGSIGYTGIVLVSGWLIQRVGFQASFWGYLLSFIGAALLLAALRTGPAPAQSLARRPLSLFVLPEAVMRSPGLIGLGLMVAITGLSNTGVAQFETVYLDQLGAPESLIGVASMIGALVEIPGMFWADRLVRRGRPERLILVALGINLTLRTLVFLFPSVAMIILTRALSGISFSFITVAMIRFVSNQTSGSETAAALAIFAVTLPNLINIASTPLAGLAFDRFGPGWLYLIALVGYLLAGVIFDGSLRRGRKQTAQREIAQKNP